MTLKELLSKKAELEQQIALIQGTERKEAIAKIKSLMAEYGLTAGDLSSNASGKKSGAVAGKKVAAKYRNEQTGESWSGRGLQPKWLKAALASGKALSDFAV